MGGSALWARPMLTRALTLDKLSPPGQAGFWIDMWCTGNGGELLFSILSTKSTKSWMLSMTNIRLQSGERQTDQDLGVS